MLAPSLVPPDRLRTIAWARWGGIVLGSAQAFLADPKPIGGPWLVLIVTLAMVGYNLPATFAPRLSEKWLARVALISLVGDFLVCSAWTMLDANDVFSTTYVTYLLVAIEATTLYRRWGMTVFTAGFVLTYDIAFYWERQTYFGFPVQVGSITYRTSIVLLAAFFMTAIAEQSYGHQRRAEEQARLAEEANRAKSRFLTRASHDLRTPLSSIIGFSQLILESGAPETQKQDARQIIKSAERLLAMINDILDLSKLEGRQIRVNFEPIDLSALADEVVEEMSPLVKARGLSLNVVYHSPVMVMADSIRMRQILTNLIGNAVKFTDLGGITVRLWRNESVARLEVADTGIGIPNEQLQTIFEDFVQLEGAVVRNRPGSGLGLSIARQLVELQNGEIGVSSKVGEGTVFWVALPALESTLTGEKVLHTIGKL